MSTPTAMENLLQQVRQPIDDFEATLVNAFSAIPGVEAIWVREVRNFLPCPATHPHPPNLACGGRATRQLMRHVWLQLHRRNLSDRRAIAQLGAELTVRIMEQPFGVVIHQIVDDLPPAVVLPSCLFRRGSGLV